MGQFSVLILSSKFPREIAGLAERLHREVSEAQVLGILYEQRFPKTFPKRIRNIWRNLRDPKYYPYAATRALRLALKPLDRVGAALLRFAHACPAEPNGPIIFDLQDLDRFGKTIGCSLFVTNDIHSPEALEFVRQLSPDLGIVFGTRILKPELFSIPRLGSVNLHKRKVPDYRGGGPVGLWELLDDQKEIGVTIHRVEVKVDTGPVVRATTIPIGPYDDLHSLDLKTAVVGNDLLVATVADFAAGIVHETPQTGASRTFKAPKAHQLFHYERQLAKRRPSFRGRRTRPAWKLLLRTLAFAPLAIARNWVYRAHKSFPVVIMYHHLITDRPHHLGMPTSSFYEQFTFLRKYYRVVNLHEAVEMLTANRVEAPTVVLTFDDGYAENFINLRAVGKEATVPASFFLATGHVSKQQPFGHDVRRNQESFTPFTWEQIRFLSRAGFEMGCHTRFHFDCGSTDLVTLRDEIVGSKVDVEAHLGMSPQYFSFPWGLAKNMSPLAVELAHSAFPYIFDAAGGVNVPSNNGKPWFLRRSDHPSDLWELELLLQFLLDLRPLSNTLPGLLRASRK